MTRTLTAAPANVTPTFISPAAVRRAQLSPAARAFGEEVRRNIDFRNRLRDLRLSLNLTQTQVAAIVYEDQGDISRFERGRANPTLERMEKILGLLTAYADEQLAVVAPAARLKWTPTPLIDAHAAARYLCLIRDEEDSFSNLKLQKLLYYAQAYAAAILRRPLFPERIKAWANGPVVPQVWHEYKEHEAQPLPRPGSFDAQAVDTEARLILERVYTELGQFEAWHLRQMTHDEDPWKSTPQNGEITLDSLRAYFEPRLASV